MPNPIGVIGLDDGNFVGKFCRTGIDINDARPIDLVWDANHRSMYLVEQATFEVPIGNVNWTDYDFVRTYPGVPVVLHTVFGAGGASTSRLTRWHLGSSSVTYLETGYALVTEPDRVLAQQMLGSPSVYFGISVFWFEPLA